MSLYSKERSKLLDIARKVVYSYREKPFVLASGKTSNHYYNCKALTLVPENLRLLAHLLRDECIPEIYSKHNLPNAAGGLTMGADPIAFALSLVYLEKNHVLYPVVVRKTLKDHGTSKLVECQINPSDTKEVLVLDDTVTTGGSSIKAVQALREAGFQVKNCLAVIDRKEGAFENLKQEGVKLYSLLTADDFW